ncbi:MAG: DUF4157 domain-containing protein [Kofleriaceae bacterium]
MSERKRPGREPGDAAPPPPAVQRKARAGAGPTTRSLPAVQRREEGLPRATSGLPRAGGGPTTASASSWLDAQPFSLHVEARSDAPGADAPTPAAAPIAAVQLHADGSDAPDADTVHAHAQRGLTGPAQPLPHLDRIQQSFGQAHDVAGIDAHVGGPATEAAAAIGASAYASGNAVAFASSPDLHTAAHEAAHVVQQRSGVSLYGGVGQAGDAYEQHADAVADRVVAGQSAADLLAPYAGPNSTTLAVQRKGHRAASQASPHGGDAVAEAVERADLAADTLTLALARGGSIDAAVAGLAQALDGLAGAVHRQQAPGDDEATRVRAVVARVEQLIQQVGARHHSAHPTLDRKARELQQRVGRVASAAAEPVREVNVARLRAHAEYSSEQLDGAAAALRGATGMEPTGVVAAQRQAQTWAATMTDPDSAAASATAAEAGRAIEQQFDVVREVAPRVAEVAQTPRTYSTGSALTAMATALGASIEPRARAAAARQRATVAYQQWQLDAAKGALESAAEDEASLGAMGQRPSGYRKGLEHRLDALEADADRGQLDTGDLEELNVDADEVALFRNAQVVISQCRQLEKVLGQLDGSDHVRGELREAATYTQTLLTKFGKQKRGDLSQRQAAAAALRNDLAQWFQSRGFFELLGGLDDDGGEHTGSAQRAIEQAQTSKTIKAIATTIVVTLVSMGIASVVAGVARAGVLATGRGAATAATAATVSGIVTDVALNTAAQKWIMHDPRRLSTLALINSAMVFAGKGVQSAMARIYSIDFRAAESLARFDVAVVHVAADAVMGAAVDYAGSRIMGEPAATPETVGDWLLAGATIGVTRGLAARLSSVDGFLAKLHDHSFDLAYRRLSPHVAEAKALIAKVNAAPTPGHLAEVLDAFERLTEAQVSVANELLTSPDRRQAHAGRTMAREHNQQRGRVEGAVRDKVLDGAGLPHDASGGAHGTAVDVALAVDTAERVGLDVAHDVSDPSAPRATLGDGDRSVTISQDRRTGRPQEHAPPTDAASLEGRRTMVARIRKTLVARRAAIAAALRGRAFVRSRHVQIGAGPHGSLNQGVQSPTHGPIGVEERLVVSDGAAPSVLASQGDLRIGQRAGAIDGPGLPARATSLSDEAGFMTSAELDDAMVLGELEAQAAHVDGRVVGALELRPARMPADGSWQVADAPMRRRLRMADGHELWVYSDRFDDLTGAGAANKVPLGAITNPDELAAGHEDGSIVAGSDPALRDKLRGNARILSVPGSPSADWAAEAGAGRGSQVDLVGDIAPARRAHWAEKIAEARASGDPAKLAEVRTAMEREAQPGLTIPRNTAPGAASNHPDVHISAGRPQSIKRLPDGRYEVVMQDIVTGEPMAPKVYDQIVYSYGQTKETYLKETFGPPPLDGILEPVFYDDAKTQLVGLRHRDTNYVVRGAAAYARDAEPWVVRASRDAWREAAARAATAGTELFDGRTLSPDSNGVAGGLEVARDRIGRGKVAEDRRDLRLPGDAFELDLGSDRGGWPERVRRFIIDQVPGAPPDKVKVVARGGAGDAAFDISIDGQPLGTWKVFGVDGAARGERALLRHLADAQLESIHTPRERGAMGTSRDGAQRGEHVLEDTVPGKTLAELAVDAGKAGVKDRKQALDRFEAAVTRTVEGLVELNLHFEDGAASPEARRATRQREVDLLLDGTLHDPAVVAGLGGPSNAALIRGALSAGPAQAYLAADLPMSAAHGNANAETFRVDHWDAQKQRWQDLGTGDLSTMKDSFAPDVTRQLEGGTLPPGAKGNVTAAGVDLGSLAASVEKAGIAAGLAPDEIVGVVERISATYAKTYADRSGRRLSIDALDVAQRWARATQDIRAAETDPGAVGRLGQLLGVTLDAPKPQGGKP